jgi:hypothetical protein
VEPVKKATKDKSGRSNEGSFGDGRCRNVSTTLIQPGSEFKLC